MRVYLVDENNEAAQAFMDLGGTGVPEIFFIDSDGTIVYHMIGYEGDDVLERYTKQVAQ